ncbi:MAG TPA: N-acyl homoserine lactonase family protein [Micromonosporaceae bacterium]|nr:N-acyl homoserine lactonase family protein [Micromonosporaceae bacterium]
MKLYALRIGATKVPYGQFYGGTQGWVGLRGIWRFLRDKSQYIMVPIYVYLIEHPQAGLILVDAGINWEQANAHHQYYRGFVAHLSMDEDEYLLSREQELPTQVRRLGYRCEDITTVIVTHLHEDHTGGLLALPHAKVVLSPPEWERVESWNGKTRFIPPLSMANLSPSVAAMRAPHLVPFTSGPCHGFDRSQDLLGDGSVIILPTPGHSSGHLAVLVRMDGYQVLCVGDTLYTLRHLDLEQVRPVAVGQKPWAAQADSIRRIQHLRHELPDTIIAPAHDHTRYASQLLEPFLADGTLSMQERRLISDYEQHLFAAGWKLNRDSMPAYIPPSDGGTVGSVTEP